MKPTVFFFLMLSLLGVVLSPLPALAYQEATVEHGGTLTGIVTLEGAAPPARTFRVSRDPFSDYCEKISDGQGNVVLDEYQVGPAGGMQDVVIAIQKVATGKPFKPVMMELNAMDCMFHPAEVAHHDMYETDSQGHVRHLHPLVTVVQNGAQLNVYNHDPIFHNGQVFQKESGHILLNFPLPAAAHRPFGGRLRIERKGETIQIVCGMHAFMQTFGLIVDNPYYARTGRDGHFVIDQVPPGDYTLMAWHPRFKPIRREIRVSPVAQVTENFMFQSKAVQRRTFEASEGLRY